VSVSPADNSERERHGRHPGACFSGRLDRQPDLSYFQLAGQMPGRERDGREPLDNGLGEMSHVGLQAWSGGAKTGEFRKEQGFAEVRTVLKDLHDQRHDDLIVRHGVLKTRARGADFPREPGGCRLSTPTAPPATRPALWSPWCNQGRGPSSP